jgi:homoserine kinase
MRLAARVPATSANVGAGFDTFGLALDLCNEVVLDTDVEPGVSWEGEGASELPTDGSDLVSRAIRAVADATSRDAPPFALRGVNRIPLERGLGSSSAAIVAGAALGYRLLGRSEAIERRAIFSIAAAIEGHADNVAAATFGGFTIVLGGERVERFDVHADVRPVVLVPERARISTEDARRRLPPSIAREDAVDNIARAAVTAAALISRPASLPRAIGDRLHEPARLALVPEVAAVLGSLRSAGVPACLSGSGPSLLAFERDAHDVPDPGAGWRVLRIGVRPAGVEVAEDVAVEDGPSGRTGSAP